MRVSAWSRVATAAAADNSTSAAFCWVITRHHIILHRHFAYFHHRRQRRTSGHQFERGRRLQLHEGTGCLLLRHGGAHPDVFHGYLGLCTDIDQATGCQGDADYRLSHHFMATLFVFHFRLILVADTGVPANIATWTLAAQAFVMALRAIAVFWIDSHDSNRFAVSFIHTIYVGTFSFSVLLFSISVLLLASEHHRREFEYIATYDGLTKAMTRVAVLRAATTEIKRAQRHKSPLSMLLLDIDHFKTINDEYGHLVGDKMLRNFVSAVQNGLRSADVLGRFGGDEFVVILPETDAPTAATVAERIRQIVAESCYIRGGKNFTTSIGCASLADFDTSVETVLARADVALYRAKERGRNAVECA